MHRTGSLITVGPGPFCARSGARTVPNVRFRARARRHGMSALGRGRVKTRDRIVADGAIAVPVAAGHRGRQGRLRPASPARAA